MARRRRHCALAWLAALLVLLASACHVPRPAGPDVPTAGAPAARAAAPNSAPAARGFLVVEVRWPQRDYKGFKAALIPTSTNALAIKVTDGGGGTLVQTVIERAAGAATASATLEVDTGSNYGVTVRAYRSATPNLDTDTAIAMGVSGSVTVSPSVYTPVPITLGPMFAPTITGFSPRGAQVGDTVVVSGENLGVVDGATPIVKFTGVTASVSAQVTPVNATSLSVVVPAGAAVGRVLVENDGVPSTTNAIFWVASQLSIDATKAEWDSTGATTRVFLPSSTNAFTATPTWVLRSGASAGSYGTPPSVSWVLAEPLAGSFDSSDRFVATDSVKASSVKARLGTLDSNVLTASVQDVTVSIAPTQTSLGPGQPLTRTFTITNTFSDSTTNTLATLTSGSPGLVAISTLTASKGAQAGNSSGTVTLTAALKGDNRRSATATVTLYNYLTQTLLATGFGTYVDQRAAAAGQVDGMVLDASGNAYIADSLNHQITKVTPAGAVSIFAGSGIEGASNGDAGTATFRTPMDVATGSNDALYLADFGNNLVRKIAGGTVTTVFSFATPARAIVADAQDTVYIAGGHCIVKKPDGQAEAVFAGDCATSGSTDATGTDARFDTPRGLALDAQGRLLVAETGRIRRITGAGVVTTIAGDGTCSDTVYEGVAASTKVCPRDVAVDAAGNIYVLGTSWIQLIDSDGILTRLAGSGSQGGAGTFQDGVGTDAKFFGALSVAVDGSRLYVGDKDTLRKLTRVP
ncbi:MAG: hypothetical protein FJZ01_08955 [Candidatus Sericytochromatia bacterium]|nr:hypothetical protein [Candidatus Tanganyikabacteria bacterium]